MRSLAWDVFSGTAAGSSMSLTWRCFLRTSGEESATLYLLPC
jgi:hypothetical protein